MVVGVQAIFISYLVGGWLVHGHPILDCLFLVIGVVGTVIRVSGFGSCGWVVFVQSVVGFVAVKPMGVLIEDSSELPTGKVSECEVEGNSIGFVVVGGGWEAWG